MSNYISKKINSLFSDEFMYDNNILVSPKKSSKFKKKKKDDLNNFLSDIQDLILLNKGINHSITKSKKKNYIKKDSNINDYSKEKGIKNINKNKSMKNALQIDFKNMNSNNIENNGECETESEERKKNVKLNLKSSKNHSTRLFKLKINKDKDVKKEKSKEKENEKELEKIKRKESKNKNKEINKELNYNSKSKVMKARRSQDYGKKRIKDKIVNSGVNTIIINNKSKKNFNYYKDDDLSLNSENMDDNNNNNEKTKKKFPSLKIKKSKKEKPYFRNETKKLMYEIEEENNTKNNIKYNNLKIHEKNAKKIEDISSSWKMSVESFSPNNFDSSHLESHDSEIDTQKKKKIEKNINHQNTQNLKHSSQEKIRTNEIKPKNDYNYNSLIKVKRANNKKKLGEVSSNFQISQRVSNLYIYSERVNNQNDKNNNNNNILCPGNFISFEYNLNGGKENNTTRDLRLKKIENNHIIINNNKLNNIMLKEESVKNSNNEIANKDINVNVNNTKDENNNKKKSKKKFCLCCL